MKRRFVLFVNLVLVLSLITACGSIAGSALPDIETGVINGNTSFAFNIFKTLSKEDAKESIFISPISISAALAMTYNGAETSTKAAMEKTLGFSGIDRTSVNEGYKNLLSHLQKIDKKISLNIGNSIWIREGQTINEKFINNNRNNFKAQVTALDFSKPAAADTINGWINDATKGKIDKMIEPPIASDVIMYLINAIYFKGDWTKKFDPKKTTDEDFHTIDGSTQSVKMMNRKDTIEYGKGEDYKSVRLPYGNGKTSMTVILPDEDIAVNTLIDKMGSEKWNEVQASLKKVDDVILKLPRFKLTYGIKNLNDSLIALGMEEAFSNSADFSGIREDIYINRVLHKAVIEVNEEGSEAAAATVVEMKEAGLAEPITFVADRPFIFLITDDVTGTILFMGKVIRI